MVRKCAFLGVRLVVKGGFPVAREFGRACQWGEAGELGWWRRKLLGRTTTTGCTEVLSLAKFKVQGNQRGRSREARQVPGALLLVLLVTALLVARGGNEGGNEKEGEAPPTVVAGAARRRSRPSPSCPRSYLPPTGLRSRDGGFGSPRLTSWRSSTTAAYSWGPTRRNACSWQCVGYPALAKPRAALKSNKGVRRSS